MSSRHENSHILAIIEGRGVGREVGIAALDRETARVNLIQVDQKTSDRLAFHSTHCY